MQPESTHVDVSNLLSASDQKQQNHVLQRENEGEKMFWFF